MPLPNPSGPIMSGQALTRLCQPRAFRLSSSVRAFGQTLLVQAGLDDRLDYDEDRNSAVLRSLTRQVALL